MRSGRGPGSKFGSDSSLLTCCLSASRSSPVFFRAVPTFPCISGVFAQMGPFVWWHLLRVLVQAAVRSEGARARVRFFVGGGSAASQSLSLPGPSSTGLFTMTNSSSSVISWLSQPSISSRQLATNGANCQPRGLLRWEPAAAADVGDSSCQVYGWSRTHFVRGPAAYERGWRAPRHRPVGVGSQCARPVRPCGTLARLTLHCKTSNAARARLQASIQSIRSIAAAN
eukprot:COSAG05_NODE_485_length_9349_cov_60.192865_10_plen_227_part_00